MAQCVICGNHISEEAYALNNGMCEVCIRTAEGGDDPIIANKPPVERKPQPQIPEPSLTPEEKRRQLCGFEAKNYSGKAIHEYTFPPYVIHGIIDCPRCKDGHALLISSSAAQEKDGLFSIIFDGLMFAVFGLIGLGTLVLLVWGIISAVSAKSASIEAIIFVAVFSIIWNILTYFLLWRKFFIHFRKSRWVLLTDDHLECCVGKRFEPQKAVHFYYDDIFLYRTYENYGNSDSCDFVAIKLQASGKNVFKMIVNSELEGCFIAEFINWYIRIKTGGVLKH